MESVINRLEKKVEQFKKYKYFGETFREMVEIKGNTNCQVEVTGIAIGRSSVIESDNCAKILEFGALGPVVTSHPMGMKVSISWKVDNRYQPEVEVSYRQLTKALDCSDAWIDVTNLTVLLNTKLREVTSKV